MIYYSLLKSLFFLIHISSFMIQHIIYTIINPIKKCTLKSPIHQLHTVNIVSGLVNSLNQLMPGSNLISLKSANISQKMDSTSMNSSTPTTGKVPRKRAPPNYQNGRVLVLKNTVTGIRYISFTASKQNLLKKLKNYAKKCSPNPMYDAINQYGIESFEVEYVVDFPCNSRFELREFAYQLEEQYRDENVELYNTGTNPPYLGEKCDVKDIYDSPSNCRWQVNTGELDHNATGTNRPKFKYFHYTGGNAESKLTAKNAAIAYKLELDHQKNMTDEYLGRDPANSPVTPTLSEVHEQMELDECLDDCTCSSNSDEIYHNPKCDITGMKRKRESTCPHGKIEQAWADCLDCLEIEMNDCPDSNKENDQWILGNTEELIDLYINDEITA